MNVSIHGLRLAAACAAFAAAPVLAGEQDWTQQEATASDGAAHEGLGRGAAILGDTAFVAATNAPAGGAVYVYVRDADGQWSETQKLNATDSPDGANFGVSIALADGVAVIGADRTTLTDDGDRHQGAAYVFTRGGDGTWTQAQELTASDFGPEAQFGHSVALSGGTLLIGAYNATIGANVYQGAAYVFTQQDGLWSEAQKLVADDGIGGDDFGNAVALDGGRALIAAPYGSGAGEQTGVAYVFEGSGGAWTQTAKLAADDGAFFDGFGTAVALSGPTALITSQYAQLGDNAGQGAVYAFELSGGQWTQTQKFGAADGAASDALGGAISLDGGQALVGASSAADYAGVAYVFARSGGNWSQIARLAASDGASGDGFGSSVALSGGAAVIGSPLKSVEGHDGQGAAYFYAQPVSDAIFTDGFDPQ